MKVAPRPRRQRPRRRRSKARDVVHGDYFSGALSAPGARLHYATCDRKLAPVRDGEYSGNRHRPEPVGPYCSATYVSIAKTCPGSCRFRGAGCYVTAGFTGPMSRKLDAGAVSAGLDGEGVIRAEAELLDRAFSGGRIPQDGGRDGKSGRDLRLHIGGDVSSMHALGALVWAADDWKLRGGGDVWTYTHRWNEIPRAEWGEISVLASVETIHEANMAHARGYVPALTMKRFPSRRTFRVEGLVDEVIPCPAETGERTCVECRLCLDAGALRRRRKAIGFAIHGVEASKVRLPVITEAA